jgi:hypothetical protein
MKTIQNNLANYNLVALTEDEHLETNGGSWFTQEVFYYAGKAAKGISNYVNDPVRGELSGAD